MGWVVASGGFDGSLKGSPLLRGIPLLSCEFSQAFRSNSPKPHRKVNGTVIARYSEGTLLRTKTGKHLD
jgi:hypothetical protein